MKSSFFKLLFFPKISSDHDCHSPPDEGYECSGDMSVESSPSDGVHWYYDPYEPGCSQVNIFNFKIEVFFY